MSTELTKSSPGSLPLTPRSREIFAQELALGTAVTMAAAKAGLSSRSGAGSKLARNRRVLERVAYLARDEEKLFREKFRRLEARQWLIRDADIAAFYETVEEPLVVAGKPVLDNEGNEVTRMRQRPRLFSDLPEELRACVEAFTLTDSGRANLKLYSKQEAHEKLCKLLGITAVRESDERRDDNADQDPLTTLATTIAELADKLSSMDEAKSS